jgi:hypothetical protein
MPGRKDRDFQSDEELALIDTIMAAASRLVELWHHDCMATRLRLSDRVVVVVERDPMDGADSRVPRTVAN